MKLCLVLATLLVTLALVDAEFAYAGLVKAMAMTCKTDEGASDDDLDKVANAEAPETKEQKCLAACLGKQFGLLIDNKISKEGIMGKIGFLIDKTDEDKKQKAEEVIDACLEVSNEDRCEAVIDISNCVMKQMETRGLEIEI